MITPAKVLNYRFAKRQTAKNRKSKVGLLSTLKMPFRSKLKVP